ncbi:MAG: dipicolinate synthase subunit DpsA [Firmicutes bacterium]|nr:dipicolinate synthase subunit DpsA [Bacillota bacterium]
MQLTLSGAKVAIMGGDAREVILAQHLAELNALVKVAGLPVNGKNIIRCQDMAEAIDNVDALILPVPGVNEEMKLYSAYVETSMYLTGELLAKLPQGSPVFVGVGKSPLKKLIKKMGLRLIEVMEINEVAILNSIPSAEGAVQLAMDNMPITIHGSRAWVMGFGRTGITLARVLQALGAKTTVVARNVSQLARAEEMGLETARYSQSDIFSEEVDVIFNTVPALVLNETILKRLPTGVLIIDIASAPGGTDFDAAKKLGIKAVLAPGLPGKVAPITAGRILAKVVPRLLADELTLR